MDPLSQGLLGATAAVSLSDKKKIGAAAVAGMIAAMAPDLDVLIRSANDPLLAVEMHRQFTHSLIFIPIGAAIVTLVLWWFLKKYLDLKEIYMFSFIGYGTHGLMDALTSYGTQLFWPGMSLEYCAIGALRSESFDLVGFVYQLMWVMNLEMMSVEAYDPLADQFCPKPGCMREAVRLASQTGMRYAVLGTKHHDGFCL